MTGPQDPFATPDPNAPQNPPADPYDQSPPPPGYGHAPFGQPQYGQPSGEQPFATGPVRGARNGLGTAALVLGILSLLTWFFLIGGLLGLAAVVLGVLGRGRAKRGEATNGGMALAGLITGLLGVLLTVLVVAGVAALFNTGEFANLRDCLASAGQDQEAIDECSRQFEDSVG